MDVPNSAYPSYIPDEPEEERKKRALAGMAIVDAAQKGQAISDSGGVPLFTNVQQPDIPANPEMGTPENKSVYVSQETLQNYNPIPKKPTDQDLSVAQEMQNILDDMKKNVKGFVSPYDIDPLSEGQRAVDDVLKPYKESGQAIPKEVLAFAHQSGTQAAQQAQQDRQQGLSMFHQAATVAQQNKIKKDAELLEQKKYDRKKKDEMQDSFKNWDSESKEISFKEKMIKGNDPLKIANRDWKERRAFNEEYYNYLKDKGLTANDVSLMQATYKAGSSSLGNMTKQEGPMRAFVSNINTQVDYAKQLFDGLKRTDTRLLNIPLRELRTKVAGSGLERQYELFMQEISMEANKLAQGSSASIAQIPEGNRKEWLAIHDINLPLKEILPVLEGTKKMANMRLQTWVDSKDFLTKEMGAIGEPVTPKQNSGFDMNAIAAELKRRKGK